MRKGKKVSKSSCHRITKADPDSLLPFTYYPLPITHSCGGSVSAATKGSFGNMGSVTRTAHLGHPRPLSYVWHAGKTAAYPYKVG